MLLALALAATYGPVHHVSAAQGAVVLTQFADVQHEIDTHAKDTTFYLRAGTYRIQSVEPKDGDTFVGAYGAILDGAKKLDHFSRDAGHQPHRHGQLCARQSG